MAAGYTCRLRQEEVLRWGDIPRAYEEHYEGNKNTELWTENIFILLLIIYVAAR